MLTEHLLPLVSVKKPLSVCCAYSGGLDSTVLLHALNAFALQHKATNLLDVTALHVNHGLSPNADKWESHCIEQCSLLGLPIRSVEVSVSREDASLEDCARKARYEAFNSSDADYVFLAHHQGDQSETLLMNLLRGAGTLGAASIPSRRGRVQRPFLSISKDELLTYAQKHKLHWIEDESNCSDAHSRNYLRQNVLPIIEKRFAGGVKNLAQAAAHFAETQLLLDDLAIEDGGELVPLAVEKLIELERTKGMPRAKNLLAFNLRRQGVRFPSKIWFDELFRQLRDSREDAQLNLEAGVHSVRRYRGCIYVSKNIAEAHLESVPWDGSSIALWGGRPIECKIVGNSGLNSRAFVGKLEFRRRQGGEVMLFNKQHRPVKDLLREAGIPPWQRSKLPILFHENEIVWVAGVGIAENYRCKAKEDGISLEFAWPNW